MSKSIPRHATLDSIDPNFAWEPWSPSDAEPWDYRRAAHLYRRIGFGASDLLIKKSVQSPPEAIVESLFPSPETANGTHATEFESESSTLATAVLASGDTKHLASWWLHRMLHSPFPLVEKMTLFWHGHFATSAEKVTDPELMLNQNKMLRELALGDFGEMVHEIAQDPAMLIYLDSATNRKAHANENFARELMELFCLGEGNYSEQDVQQLARCFTGWEIRRKQFRFNPYQHDNGVKVLLGQSGIESGKQAIDAVLGQKALPEFIVSKLVRFFVCDEPSPGRAFLQPLIDQFLQDNLNVKGVMKRIVGSRLLLSDWSFARKVRSPVEMAVQFLKGLDATTNLNLLSQRLREVGHYLFYPPNVKGWDGGRAWINSSTLVGRANLIFHLLHDENTRFDDTDFASYAATKGSTPTKFLRWFEKNFFAVELQENQVAQLSSQLDQQSDKLSSRAILSLAAALPQFHLN